MKELKRTAEHHGLCFTTEAFCAVLLSLLCKAKKPFLKKNQQISFSVLSMPVFISACALYCITSKIQQWKKPSLIFISFYYYGALHKEKWSIILQCLMQILNECFNLIGVILQDLLKFSKNKQYCQDYCR